ncbi:MAG: glycoside hydrolase family 30 beta sandwich domain-containing protein [Arcicella sp.]|nr:glycoside hydrolase family 30 beta sandwich domain-containing protein [Arcicella sp.]
MKNFTITLTCFLVFIISCSSSNKGGNVTPVVAPITTIPVTGNDVEMWFTTANRDYLLQKSNTVLTFATSSNSSPTIEVDTTQTFQTIDGFGYTLTGGSASLINKMSFTAKANLLQELFGNNINSIGISYLRISIGASDLNESVFSYNDLLGGETDLNLDKFDFSLDKNDLIPLLKEIVKINPNIKILGSPWSPPVWMKDNGSSKGGSLKPEYYEVYANYFVKYIQKMKKEGLTIDAITIQNEPENPNNNPSLSMSATQQTNFIKNNLGPAFQKESIKTKIIVWDHNCDNPNYPISILNDPAAKAFIDGSAFHLYAGNIAALSTVRNAHKDKNLYFTEQWTSSKGDFGGDFMWHLKNVIIGSMKNWSKTALEWNLANDSNFRPHTPGGCTECKGALTIGSTVERNVAYYVVAQISKFVPQNSVRIATTEVANLQNVAFKTPSGKKVMIVLNEANQPTTFNIKSNNKFVNITLPAQSAGTFIW